MKRFACAPFVDRKNSKYVPFAKFKLIFMDHSVFFHPNRMNPTFNLILD